MHIEEATEADFDEVKKLFRALDSYHSQIASERIPDYEGESRSYERYKAYIEGDDRVLFVARVSNEIKAFANIQIQRISGSQLHLAREYALIDNLYVAEEFRRKGVATALIKRSERWCQEKGISKIELQVYTANEQALSLYKALGYVPYLARMERDILAQLRDAIDGA